jgi:molecular chaperone Hsp33
MKQDDYLVRATAHGGLVRAFALDAGGVVSELARRHQTWPAATAALGRLSIGALLFGAMLKEEDHLVTLRIKADGPGGTLLASANGRGEVRGLIANPQPDVAQSRNRKLNVSGVVGRRGELTVTRDLGLRHPYTGTVALVSGEVSEDLAHYLARSEQIPSALGIGVFVQRAGIAAGGYLVQLLPGVDDDVAAGIEATIRELPHPTRLLRDGDTPEAILARIFGADGFEVLDRRPVRFACPCSRDRAERAILLLGPGPIREMMEDARAEGRLELKCEFCTRLYHFSVPELEALLAQL